MSNRNFERPFPFPFSSSLLSFSHPLVYFRVEWPRRAGKGERGTHNTFPLFRSVRLTQFSPLSPLNKFGRSVGRPLYTATKEEGLFSPFALSPGGSLLRSTLKNIPPPCLGKRRKSIWNIFATLSDGSSVEGIIIWLVG